MEHKFVAAFFLLHLLIKKKESLRLGTFAANNYSLSNAALFNFFSTFFNLYKCLRHAQII